MLVWLVWLLTASLQFRLTYINGHTAMVEHTSRFCMVMTCPFYAMALTTNKRTECAIRRHKEACMSIHWVMLEVPTVDANTQLQNVLVMSVVLAAECLCVHLLSFCVWSVGCLPQIFSYKTPQIFSYKTQ